jgi:hypothetical protein
MQLRSARKSCARAAVVEPEQATRRELLTFHDGQFVRQNLSQSGMLQCHAPQSPS